MWTRECKSIILGYLLPMCVVMLYSISSLCMQERMLSFYGQAYHISPETSRKPTSSMWGTDLYGGTDGAGASSGGSSTNAPAGIGSMAPLARSVDTLRQAGLDNTVYSLQEQNAALAKQVEQRDKKVRVAWARPWGRGSCTPIR